MNTSEAALRNAFKAEYYRLRSGLVDAPVIPVSSWQSTGAPQGMPEIRNAEFSLDLMGIEDLSILREVIEPSTPWADDHFVKERVSGQPKNPGTTWRQWPYARSADKHRVEGEEDPQFDHSYAERYWPRYAGVTSGGLITQDGVAGMQPLKGIRDEYGDLSDLIELLLKDPLTRQAYLPVWFPEDLRGTVHHNRRVPCSLGYHFMIRNRKLHCYYPMRSCDFIRHFRDDVYLTIRLQIHILQILRARDPENFRGVQVGDFLMHMSSLHCFELDQQNMVHEDNA